MNEIKDLVKKYRKNSGSLSARQFEKLQGAAADYTADRVMNVDHSGPGAPPHFMACADLTPIDLSALAATPEARAAGGFVGQEVRVDADAARDAYELVVNPPLGWAGFRPVEESRAKRAGKYIAKWIGWYVPYGARILDHIVTIAVCLAGITHSIGQGKVVKNDEDADRKRDAGVHSTEDAA